MSKTTKIPRRIKLFPVFLVIVFVAITLIDILFTTQLDSQNYLVSIGITYVCLAVTIGTYLRSGQKHMSKYFIKIGSENVVKEFHYLKTIIGIGLFIVVYTITIAAITTEGNILLLIKEWQFPERIIVYAGLTSGFFLYGGFVRYGTFLRNKDFRYIYAKGCFVLVSKENKEFKKIQHMIKGLNSYNDFLKRHLRLKINNSAKIVQKIISNSTTDGGKSIIGLTNSFYDENELEPIRYLSRLNSLLEKEQLLVNSPFGDKIKGALLIIAVIAPLVFTGIGILINFLKI